MHAHLHTRFVLTLAGLLFALGAHACPKTADRSLVGPAIGEDMVVNGMPVQIQQVSSRDSVKDVMARVEQTWREAGFNVKRQDLAQWKVISALSEECLTTLQLTDSKGTVGFLAIGEPDKTKDRAAVVKKGDVPLPSGSQVVSTLSAKDGPRASTTTMITSKRSVTDMREHFVRGLEQAGYGNVRAQEVQGASSMDRAQLVSGQRGGDIVQVVIFNQQGTTAVINQGQAL
jgi:hypothetical protein